MPQVVDLEALVCGGGCGEGKVACETLVGPPPHPPPPDDPDLPADSFRLPLEDVIDWVSRNAVAPYDRDGSTRGVTNPKFAGGPHLPTTPKFHAGSLRLYSSPKVPIIGLPSKIKSSGYLGQSARRQHCSKGRFFPKRCGDTSGGSGRTVVPEMEPTSPKVSCFGTVLSDQDKYRRRGTSAGRDVSRESSSVAASASAWETTGFWASVLGFTCCRQRQEAAALLGEQEAAASSGASTTANGEIVPSAAFAEETAMAAPTPGLGGMRRFESGRRPASWGGDLEFVVDDLDRSGPSPQRRGEVVLPGRRSVDSLTDLESEREWELGGAASV